MPHTEIDPGALSDAELTGWMRSGLADADTATVRRLRDALLAREAAGGIGDVHRLAGELLRDRRRLVHGAQHLEELSGVAVAPGGDLVATGARFGDDHDAGTEVVIWDVATGQAVHVVTAVPGGVGWPSYPGQLRWAPDGETLYLGFDTNGVGRLDPFAADTAEAVVAAYVTNGWGRPPAWALGPGGELAVLVHGPDDERTVALVRLADRTVDEDGCDWLDNRVPPALRQDPDDELAIADIYTGAGVHYPDADRILVHNGGELLAFDRGTGSLRWRTSVSDPVALSAGARYVAHHPAGIVFHDGTDGTPTPWLPMHVGASALVFTGEPGGDAPPRTAAVVEAGNTDGTEPGVHVYDAGEFVCGPDLTPAAPDDEFDLAVLAFAPDGTRFACLTDDGGLDVWRLDGRGPGTTAHREHRLDGVGGGEVAVRGVAWPRPDRLVLAGLDGLVFADPLTGRVVSRRPCAPQAAPDPATDDVPTPRRVPVGGRWAVLDGAAVVAATRSVAQLDAQIAWAVDRRVGWPLRWCPPDVRAPRRPGRRAAPPDFPPPQTAGPVEVLHALVAATAELAPDAVWHYSEILASAAREFARLGRFEDLFGVLPRIVRDPGVARAQCVAVLVRRGDSPHAEALLEQDPLLRAITPEAFAGAGLSAHEHAHYGAALGAMHVALGDGATADRWFALAETVVDRDEHRPGEHRGALGYGLLLAGLPDRAAALLRRPLPEEPDSSVVNPVLFLLAREGRWDCFDALAWRDAKAGGATLSDATPTILHLLLRHGRDDDTVLRYVDHLRDGRWGLGDYLDPARRAAIRIGPAPTPDDENELRDRHAELIRRPRRAQRRPAAELCRRAVEVGHWSAAIALLPLLDGTDVWGRPNLARELAERAITGCHFNPW